MDIRDTGKSGGGPGVDTSPAAARVQVTSSLPAAATGTPPPTEHQVLAAVKAVQATVEPLAKDLRFSVDKASGRIIVKVMDSQTNTVLCQIPSKEILAMAHALDKLQGLLVRSKA